MATMTYLDLARSALARRDTSVQCAPEMNFHRRQDRSSCEISEQSEKRSGPDGRRTLTAAEAEQLKREIIAAVTVVPEDFDRQHYEALLARWNTHEAAMAGHTDEGQVA